MYCPYCGNAKVTRAGIQYGPWELRQMWRCRNCLRQWTQTGFARIEMKLQRSISLRRRGREYAKHMIVIPSGTTELLGWKPGESLEGHITKGAFIIVKNKRQQFAEKRIGYEEWKKAIINVLRKSYPKGLLWSELRYEAGLPDVTPSAIWVKRLEQDGMLRRRRESGITTWFLGRTPNINVKKAKKWETQRQS